MRIRCQRCSHMFTLSREALTAALQTVERAKAKHYDVECPKCRRQIKVSVKDLERFRPR